MLQITRACPKATALLLKESQFAFNACEVVGTKIAKVLRLGSGLSGDDIQRS
jgi:hypothetical protein